MEMDNKTREQIGLRINAALALSGKQQKELAKELDVPDNTVSYWCSGARTPNTAQIIGIARFTDVSADYLLGLSDVPSPDTDVQAICDHFGMTEDAYEGLCRLYECQKYKNGNSLIDGTFEMNIFLKSFNINECADKFLYALNHFIYHSIERKWDDDSNEYIGKKHRLLDCFRDRVVSNITDICHSEYKDVWYEIPDPKQAVLNKNKESHNAEENE